MPKTDKEISEMLMQDIQTKIECHILANKGYKFCYLNLPVTEQGEDLRYELEQADGNVKKGFKDLAERYEYVAHLCRIISESAEKDLLFAIGDEEDIIIYGKRCLVKELMKGQLPLPKGRGLFLACRRQAEH